MCVWRLICIPHSLADAEGLVLRSQLKEICSPNDLRLIRGAPVVLTAATQDVPQVLVSIDVGFQNNDEVCDGK